MSVRQRSSHICIRLDSIFGLLGCCLSHSQRETCADRTGFPDLAPKDVEGSSARLLTTAKSTLLRLAER